VRPLEVLENAMESVGAGRLEPIQLSRTGDEIERLGGSFNRMIIALAAAEQEVQEHREHLEEKIRQRTEALEETMRNLEAASRAKSEFLANMSHEVRTPMNGILGMLDIVLDSDLNADQREELLTAKECSVALLSLINDILDLSRIEAGKLDLEQISFEPRTVIDACVKSVRPKAAEKGLDLIRQVDPSVPREVSGDPLRLRQILVNLLGNAVKFTEQGFVRLSVHADASALAGRIRLEIEVADTGIGIPGDKLAAIFEEFTQADGSTTRKYGGTGLGLAITRKLVEMHEGRIQVKSELGHGSVFHVTLELHAADTEAAAPATRKTCPPQGVFS